MLIWQGHIRINEDDAADILQLIPALEKEGAARSLNHYRKVLAQRMDKEKGALFSFREKKISYRKRPSARGSTMKLNSRRVRSR